VNLDPNKPDTYKVFLSNMQPELAESLSKILKDEVMKNKKEIPQPAAKLSHDSKKRKIDQMSNPNERMTNLRNKVRKITNEEKPQAKSGASTINT
jgi:hypothetical protein